VGTDDSADDAPALGGHVSLSRTSRSLRAKASGWPAYPGLPADEPAVVAREHGDLLTEQLGGGHRRAPGEGVQGLLAHGDDDLGGGRGQRVDVGLIAGVLEAPGGVFAALSVCRITPAGPPPTPCPTPADTPDSTHPGTRRCWLIERDLRSRSQEHVTSTRGWTSVRQPRPDRDPIEGWLIRVGDQLRQDGWTLTVMSGIRSRVRGAAARVAKPFPGVMRERGPGLPCLTGL